METEYPKGAEVMNPPASAARDAEAGNLNMPPVVGLGASPVRADVAQATRVSAAPTIEDQMSVLWNRRVSGRQFLRACNLLETLPPFLRDAVVCRYASIAGQERIFYARDDGRVHDTWNDADRDLRAMHVELQQSRPDVAFDDDEIERLASLAARHCMCETSQDEARAYVLAHGVRVPKGPRITEHGLWRRLRSRDWWRRQLRAALTRNCEAVFRRLGFVRSAVRASPYISEDALRRVRSAHLKGRRWIQETLALCEDTGETIPLEQIAAHSLANPKLRRGELMTRARGFQECAQASGHRCLMVTLTCPSSYHSWLRSGDRNVRYNGTTPREAQAWLNRSWARARAAIHRRKIVMYGFRAVEPHHEGCPHWHAILYVPPENVATVRDLLTRAWLREDADEPGALEHRIKFTDEDPQKGSGVGYLAKYVSKNIDGYGTVGTETSDESGQPVSEDAERVIAWARIWGIRQFSQVGGPAVGTWRELRRVREPSDCPPLEAIRLTTDHTDQGGPSWSRFIGTLGGIADCLPASRGLLDKAEPRKVDKQGRTVIRLNRWGELPGSIVIGLRITWRGRIKRLPTRLHIWILIFRPPLRLGPVAITVLCSGAPDSWTNPLETSRAGPEGETITCEAFEIFGGP